MTGGPHDITGGSGHDVELMTSERPGSTNPYQPPYGTGVQEVSCQFLVFFNF